MTHPKKLKVQMKDKSIFEMPNDSWQKAWNLKYGGEAEQTAINAFIDTTAKHWKSKTIPTKFGFDEAWRKDYRNHAELGQDIMYPYIRAPLLAIAMEQMAKDMGQKTAPSVLALGKDRTTEYTGHSAKEVDLDNALDGV